MSDQIAILSSQTGLEQIPKSIWHLHRTSTPAYSYPQENEPLNGSLEQVIRIVFFHNPTYHLRVDMFTGFSVSCKGLVAC